jgi:hypothetical protein
MSRHSNVYHLPRVAGVVAALACCVAALTVQAGQSEFPAVDTFGLPRVESARVQALYLDPQADFSRYTRVAIGDVEVAFRKNWMRDQNQSRRSPGSRITDQDAERIRGAIAELFRTIFREELVKGGYEVVEGPVVTDEADNLLILVPAILNLDVTAPDKMTAGRSRTFTTTAGSMTLYLEFHEAVSDALLGRALDSKTAPDRSYMSISNSVTNRAEASRMLRRWARMLVEALDRAHGKP